MAAGRFRHAVEIQSPDADGINWSKVANWRCDIRPISGRERIEIAIGNATISHRLEGWWQSGIDSSMRAVLGSRKFYFQSVINVGERNRVLQIITEERERNS